MIGQIAATLNSLAQVVTAQVAREEARAAREEAREARAAREIHNVRGVTAEAGVDPEVISDRLLQGFLRYGPPRFDGEANAEKAEEWLDRLEDIYTPLAYTEDRKVTYAAFLLSGDAREWWRMTRKAWEVQRTPFTWASFVQSFKDKYIPEVVESRRIDEFISLKQGSMTVSQYEAKFERLSKYLPDLVSTEKRKIHKFIDGLRPDMQDMLVTHKFDNYVDAVAAALRLEKRRSRDPAEASSSRPVKKFFIPGGSGKQPQSRTFFIRRGTRGTSFTS